MLPSDNQEYLRRQISRPLAEEITGDGRGNPPDDFVYAHLGRTNGLVLGFYTTEGSIIEVDMSEERRADSGVSSSCFQFW